MESKKLDALKIAFGLHLLFSNSLLLLESNMLQTFSVVDEMPEFLRYPFIIIFAGSYSFMTIMILDLYPKKYLVLGVALLDGYGIMIKYAPIENNFLLLTAIYFSIYTTLIPIAIYYIKNRRYENNTNNSGSNISNAVDNSNVNNTDTKSNNGIFEALNETDKAYILSKQKNKDIAYAVQKVLRGEKSSRDVTKELNTSPNKVSKIKKMFEN